MSSSIVQAHREKGFKTALAKRGAALKLLRIGTGFTALIEPVQSAAHEFRVEPDLAMSAIIHVLRSANAILINDAKIGDVFHDQQTGTGYRIQRIEDQPANIAVKFHCETYRDSTL